MHKAKHAILETAAQMVEAEAKNLIGVPHEFWEPLKPETIARKARGNTPLLETGELRDSIEHTIIDSHHAEVGSNSDIAVFQELGTASIPPRSFLMQAAVHKEEEVNKIAKELAVAALLPHSLQGAIAKIAFEALRDLGHSIKENVEDLTSANNEPPSPRDVARGVGQAAGHIARGLK
jgi:phage gpG-like protein